MQGVGATPEQAAQLTSLLDTWEAQLVRLEAHPELPGEPPLRQSLTQSRRILENYRRTLSRDLARGLARVPAAELFRAISTAQASLKQLDALEARSYRRQLGAPSRLCLVWACSPRDLV